ncbi:hypothetical protein F2Q69_00036696 [Brassica cretica]|uniref:Secreted protein n=1 Tax=Brassica cretica TaxID=69181 RepID=A0A8S9SC95_BRACR|nr:hypothetical protein F2Q69_00036696 [Brassica cretica]
MAVVDLILQICLFSWSGVSSFRGVRGWCLVLGPGCASAQGRRRWSIVGAYTGMLAGCVSRVSLWGLRVCFKRLTFICRLWQSQMRLR